MGLIPSSSPFHYLLKMTTMDQQATLHSLLPSKIDS